MDTLSRLVDAQLAVEKIRVREQVRQSHLALDGRTDPDTDELVAKLTEIEGYIDGRVAEIIVKHPAYPWFSQVKGIGKENIGKVVGLIRIKSETDDEGKELPYAQTISGLWKFAGYAPVDGHAEKRVRGGGKLEYNSQLRTMCWRLGSSLMRAGGSFYNYYVEQKKAYTARYEATGMKIVPATSLPTVKNEEGKRKKTETDEVISEGHVHNQALRKMIKLFLACLWLEWRKAERLPTTSPYAIDILKHGHLIDPAAMIDKPAAVTLKKTRTTKRAQNSE